LGNHFFAAAAGFFLDIFSYIFLGASAVLLLFIGFLAKRLQLVLKEGRSAHPLFYFLPLFLVFFVAYRISLALIGMAFFDYKFIFEAAYNLTAALVLFLAYKKFFADRKESISFFV